jgi:hypothetical protein
VSFVAEKQKGRSLSLVWLTSISLTLRSYLACRRMLQKDGLQLSGEGWLLAQYNDPGTAPPFRRNEVLIPLHNFQLW